jgi:hypothetical protein
MGTATDSKYLTLGEFGEHLATTWGVSLKDIKADGIKLVASPGRLDEWVELEVTLLCRDDQGKLFIQGGEVATKVRRFPIVSLVVANS